MTAIANHGVALECAQNSAAFRRALGEFPTGVTVVTTSDQEMPHGCTVNSFTSVSLDPPLVLVCLLGAGAMLERLRRAERFAVNVLRADQWAVAKHFANPRRPPGHAGFGNVEWTTSPLGAPLLLDAVVHLDCRLEHTFDAGDHGVCVGRVVGLARHDGDPLAFFRGRAATVRRADDAQATGWPWI